MNAAERARLAKEKEAQAKLHKLEERQKQKQEKKRKKREDRKEFFNNGFGWILVVLSSLMILINFVLFLACLTGVSDLELGLLWLLFLVNAAITVLSVLQCKSNGVMLMMEVGGPVIFVFYCITYGLVFLGLLGTL